MPGRPHLPLQGGRVRRAPVREPDLGVAHELAPVHPRRRHRARQRRPDPGDRSSAGDRARDRAEARRARRREPRVAPCCRMIKRTMISGLNATGVDVSDLRVLPPGGQPPPPEDGGLRHRLPRRRQPCRPRGRDDPVLRAAGRPAQLGSGEGDREELRPPGAAACRRRRRGVGRLPGPGAGELRAGPPATRSTGTRSPARLPDRRRLRLLGRLVRAAARGRPASGRGDLGARLQRRATGRRDGLSQAIGQTKRLVAAVGADLGAVFDRAGERMFLVDERGEDVPAEQTLLLFLRLLAQRGPRGKVAVPNTATSKVDRIARLRAWRSCGRSTRSRP